MHGSLYCLCHLRLDRVITLVLVLRLGLKTAPYKAGKRGNTLQRVPIGFCFDSDCKTQ